MSGFHHRLLLWAAATDRTFRIEDRNGERFIVGKCIHCNALRTLDLHGEPGPGTTLEHIVPRHHGGTHALANIAIACARCNGQKGSRLDHRPWHDATLQAVITRLKERREARWREAPEAWGLPPRPPEVEGPDPATPSDNS
jgi:5-methylcytosine-specific restriction endonuclease McrA